MPSLMAVRSQLLEVLVGLEGQAVVVPLCQRLTVRLNMMRTRLDTNFPVQCSWPFFPLRAHTLVAQPTVVFEDDSRG